MGIVDDIKLSFQQGNLLTRLIYINLGVFLVIHIVAVIIKFAFRMEGIPYINDWLAVPSNLGELIWKPWTLFTYMFLHVEFYHILSNLIFLYFGGRMFAEFLGEKRLVAVYVLGGFSGAVLYILFFNIFPYFSEAVSSSSALGASASVLAILVAIATYIPNYVVRLFFVIEVKLKYIALFLVVLDIASMSSSNSGGHIAHLGGAIFGYYYVKGYQKGVDWSNGFYRWVNTFKSLLTSKRSKMKVAYKSDKTANARKKPVYSTDQDHIDLILDKISKSGYDSLTKDEKDTLFRASKD
jgi:membrane associated rhomboid family serine protease